MCRASAAWAMSIVRFITSKLPSFGTDSSLAVSTRSSSPCDRHPDGVAERPGVEQRRVLRHIRVSHSVVALGSASGSWPPASLPLEADRDRQVGVDGRDRCHRQRIEDAAVGEQPAVEHVRDDHPGNRDRRADRRVHRTALQPHRLAGDQIGGHRGVRDRQLLDRDLAEDVAHGVEDLLGAQHTRRGDRRVEQPQHRALRQRLGPVGEFVQLAGRVQAADERAHRRPGDPDDVVAAVTQLVDHSDVGVPASSSAAEGQCHRALPGHTATLCPSACIRGVPHGVISIRVTSRTRGWRPPLAATITPACWAGVSWTTVCRRCPGRSRRTPAALQIRLDQGVRIAALLAPSTVFAAWQAWQYSSSVTRRARRRRW